MKPIYSEYITKIEGHGLLYFDFAKNKANFEVAEGERLFEQLVLGRTPEEIPFLVARICGVCPTAHHLAAIKAMEKIFKIEPTETTVLLRKLLIVAQIIQSHNLHLYFLVLPNLSPIISFLNFNLISKMLSMMPNIRLIFFRK